MNSWPPTESLARIKYLWRAEFPVFFLPPKQASLSRILQSCYSFAFEPTLISAPASTTPKAFAIPPRFGNIIRIWKSLPREDKPPCVQHTGSSRDFQYTGG